MKNDIDWNKVKFDEPNPNRESQQEYFGLTQSKPQYFGEAKVFSGPPICITGPVDWKNNMNDDNRFGNNNNDNARLVQAQISAQANGLQQLAQLEQQRFNQQQFNQQQFNPWQNEIENLKKQLAGSVANSAKMLEQKRDSEIEILQLKLEVAQLRLALAKAEK